MHCTLLMHINCTEERSPQDISTCANTVFHHIACSLSVLVLTDRIVGKNNSSFLTFIKKHTFFLKNGFLLFYISVFTNRDSPSGAVFVFSLWEHEAKIHVK